MPGVAWIMAVGGSVWLGMSEAWSMGGSAWPCRARQRKAWSKERSGLARHGLAESSHGTAG